MIKCGKRLLCVFICIAVLSSSLFFVSANTQETKIKNVIYMIPDGAGMASFFLADYVKQEGGFSDEKFPNLSYIEDGEMYIKDYLVGAETTYSASHSTTDSAAGGTALAGGYKTNNGVIGIDPDYKPHATILEACQYKGMTTGIVATHAMPDATPAAFSSHAESRTDQVDIGTQESYQNIDLIIANYSDSYKKQEWYSNAFLEGRGYKVVENKEQLNEIKAGDKVFGKIPGLYYESQRAAETPTLAEITTAALRALDDGNENGFFLMVEGSAIDGGGHDSSVVNLTGDWLAFDAACKVAIEYAKQRTDTIVIILPDHDTGGLTVTKGDYTSESLRVLTEDVKNGIDTADLPWEGWITGDANKRRSHTNRDGGIFMYLPEGVEYPEGIDISKKEQVLSDFEANFKVCETNRIDNTVIAPYIANLLNVDLEKTTEKLFIDTTDFGTYDSATGVFTITTSNGTTVTVEKNKSIAQINGETVELDGQVAVYVGERFYAPQILFDKLPVKNEGIQIYADYNAKAVTVEGVTKEKLSDISVIVTEPKKTISESIGADGYAALPYITQIKSAPWKEYKVYFKVDKGQIGDYKYYTKINNSGEVKEYAFSFKDMSVTKNSTLVENITELSKGDVIELVLKGFDSQYDGIAAIAQYDENNNLIGITTENIKGSATEYDDYSSLEAVVLENVKTIKTYYWKNTNIAPFTGAYVIY